MSELGTDFHERLVLDGTKIGWHRARLEAWERGERRGPISVDMATTRSCQARCHFCFSALQGQEDNQKITTDVMYRFLDDCAELDVKGISFVSDGESTLSKCYVPSIQRGHALGISMASGTNAERLTRDKLEAVLPCLTYLRVNFSGGTRERYSQIMGVEPEFYDRVCENIRTMVEIKRRDKLPVTLGMQMVLTPQDADQILPFARLGKELGVCYSIVKHCSDDELGTLAVDYDGYERLYGLLREAEALSTDDYKVVVKWKKIEAKGKRSYNRCYGPQFLLQISGSGLVAPCGMLFHSRFKDEWHLGNIVTERFKDIVMSDRYWEAMAMLASPAFDAQVRCGTLCLQNYVNEALDRHVKGLEIITEPTGPEPLHKNFI